MTDSPTPPYLLRKRWLNLVQQCRELDRRANYGIDRKDEKR